MQKAMQLVAKERIKQRQHGYTEKHDDSQYCNEWPGTSPLRMAAVCYEENDKELWPWKEELWKPSLDRKGQLIKAAALYHAEYERLGRIEYQTLCDAMSSVSIYCKKTFYDYHRVLGKLDNLLNDKAEDFIEDLVNV